MRRRGISSLMAPLPHYRTFAGNDSRGGACIIIIRSNSVAWSTNRAGGSMVSTLDESIYPETEPLIRHARSLPDRDITDRLVPYANIGVLIARRAEEAPHKNYLPFYEEDGRPVPEWSLTYRQFF